MTVNTLYLHHPERYTTDNTLTAKDLANRIFDLCEFQSLLKRKFGPIYRDDLIFCSIIYQKLAVYQLLWEDQLDVSQDAVKMLEILLNETISLPKPHANGRLGIYPSAPTEFDISSESDLLQFVRNMQPPIDSSNNFFDWCNLAFPDIIFGDSFPECLNTFDGSFFNFTDQLIECFTFLNDRAMQLKGQDPWNEVMSKFTASTTMQATLESNAVDARKRRDKFCFSANNVDYEIEVPCDPHFKLSRSNNTGDSKHYHNRVYFGLITHEHHPEKIYIKHAGQHL